MPNATGAPMEASGPCASQTAPRPTTAPQLMQATVVVAPLVPPPPTAVLAPHDRAIKRWLAARLFGSWIAYQGNALDTVVRYLRACHDVFLVELARDGDPRAAIRRSDRLIVHDSSSQQIANLLNDCS